MLRGRTSLCCALLAFGVSACQHIPPEPLNLAASPVPDLAVQPIRDFAASLTGQSSAEAFDAADGLTLREAQAVALWYNPRLRIARLQVEAAKASAGAAGRMPDPELGLEGGQQRTEEEGLLWDAGETTRSWMDAASLSITVPLSGRRRAEKAWANAQVATAEATALEAEWQTLREVREAWAEWSAAQEHLRLLDSHIGMSGNFARSATALADLGEAAPTSARLFAIDAARLEAQRDALRQQSVELRARLLELMGLLPDSPVTLVPALEAATAEDAVAPEQHPAVARARAEYDAAEERLRLELRRQYPDITFSPSYSREKDESALVLGLGVPVPVWDRNRAGIAEASSAREIARAEAEAQYHRVLSEASQARAALQGASARRQRLVEEVGPMVDQQMAEAQALLEAGEMEPVALFEALGQALEVKEDLIDAALAEALAAARVDAAAGAGVNVLLSSQEMEQ